MTIGKLPATGPSPSPTQKTRKPPTTTGLASSKPNRPRTACRQSPSSPNPERPQNHLQRHRAEPALPTRRLPGPVAPPRPSGRSRTPHPPRSRLRDRRKAVRRQARPRLMRRRPRPPPAFGKPAPAPSKPADARRRPPGGQELLEPAKTQSVGKPTPSTQQPAPSIGKPAPAPSKPTGRSAPRPQNESAPVPTRVRATTRAGSRTDSVSERPGGLELEQGGAPVQRVCFDHYRTAHQIAVPETTELYLNGVNLTRDALRELQKLPIELLSRTPHPACSRTTSPSSCPVPCARWRSSAMRCRRKHCWPRRDGIRDCCRYRHGAPRRTMRTPSHWHNPPPSRPSILHRTA